MWSTIFQSHFGRGSYIVRQGVAGDTFYIISEGNVKVTQKKEGKFRHLSTHVSKTL